MTAHRFVLARHSDPSGISGTGLICEGIEWTGGCVSLHWLTDWPSVATFTSMDDVLAVHGHNGATLVRWLDVTEPEPTTSKYEHDPIHDPRD